MRCQRTCQNARKRPAQSSAHGARRATASESPPSELSRSGLAGRHWTLANFVGAIEQGDPRARSATASLPETQEFSWIRQNEVDVGERRGVAAERHARRRYL